MEDRRERDCERERRGRAIIFVRCGPHTSGVNSGLASSSIEGTWRQSPSELADKGRSPLPQTSNRKIATLHTRQGSHDRSHFRQRPSFSILEGSCFFSSKNSDFGFHAPPENDLAREGQSRAPSGELVPHSSLLFRARRSLTDLSILCAYNQILKSLAILEKGPEVLRKRSLLMGCFRQGKAGITSGWRADMALGGRLLEGTPHGTSSLLEP